MQKHNTNIYVETFNIVVTLKGNIYFVNWFDYKKLILIVYQQFNNNQQQPSLILHQYSGSPIQNNIYTINLTFKYSSDLTVEQVKNIIQEYITKDIPKGENNKILYNNMVAKEKYCCIYECKYEDELSAAKLYQIPSVIHHNDLFVELHSCQEIFNTLFTYQLLRQQHSIINSIVPYKGFKIQVESKQPAILQCCIFIEYIKERIGDITLYEQTVKPPQFLKFFQLGEYKQMIEIGLQSLLILQQSNIALYKLSPFDFIFNNLIEEIRFNTLGQPLNIFEQTYNNIISQDFQNLEDLFYLAPEIQQIILRAYLSQQKENKININDIGDIYKCCIYSFGLVLLECGTDIPVKELQTTTKQLEALNIIKQNFNKQLSEVIRLMLNKDQRKRPTITELQQHLQNQNLVEKQSSHNEYNKFYLNNLTQNITSEFWIQQTKEAQDQQYNEIYVNLPYSNNLTQQDWLNFLTTFNSTLDSFTLQCQLYFLNGKVLDQILQILLTSQSQIHTLVLDISIEDKVGIRESLINLFSVITKLINLSVLSIKLNNNITQLDDFIIQQFTLGKLQNLQQFGISLNGVNNIKDNGFQLFLNQLQYLKKLTLFDISFNQNKSFTDSALYGLSKVFKSKTQLSTTLKQLCLGFDSNQNFTNKGFCTLIDSIKNIETLQNLSLNFQQNTNFTDEVLLNISALLTYNKSKISSTLAKLKLNFEKNKFFSEQGISKLIQSFENLFNLTHLVINLSSNNNVNDSMLTGLADQIKMSQTLQSSLSYIELHFNNTNKITDTGLCEFFKALPNLAFFMNLTLGFACNSKITDNSLITLAECIYNNTSLQRSLNVIDLNFKKNQRFSDHGLITLLNSFVKLKQLTVFKLNVESNKNLSDSLLKVITQNTVKTFTDFSFVSKATTKYTEPEIKRLLGVLDMLPHLQNIQINFSESYFNKSGIYQHYKKLLDKFKI